MALQEKVAPKIKKVVVPQKLFQKISALSPNSEKKTAIKRKLEELSDDANTENFCNATVEIIEEDEEDNLEEDPQPSTSTLVEYYEAALGEETEMAEDTEDETTKKQFGEGYYRWNPPSVFLLLDAYQSVEEKLRKNKITRKKAWQQVSERLVQEGYNATWEQCYAKMKSLQKTYKSVKAHNNSSYDKRNWAFFEKMDEIFGNKPWGKDKSFERANDNGWESRSQLSSSSSKKLAALLRERLNQKAEHEADKRRRHKERMEVQNKILAVLSRIADD